MNVTVKDFISGYTSVGNKAMPVDFFVKLISKPLLDGSSNTIVGWYNEAPYMYNDAKVISWHIEKSHRTTMHGENYIVMYIAASDL